MPKSLNDILVSKKILTLEESADTKKEAKERGTPLDEILYGRGIKESDVAQAKSELTGYPLKHLEGGEVPFDVLRDIPEESARYYKMVPLGRKEGFLDVGMLYPEDVAAQQALKFIASRENIPARIFIITPADFQNVLNEYKSLSGEVTKALGEFEKEYEDFGTIRKPGKEELGAITEEAPVIKMFAVIMRHAVEGRASDIHIEPTREKLRVRFRVDGVLYTSLLLPAGVHSAIITRIKVLSSLKLDENRVPQDGRFHAEILGRGIDFRVSTFPTAFGEKAAIRILDPEAGIKTLADLGLEGRNLKVIEESIKKPYGMILITGPTGSGKSTTLYAVLQLLNQEGVNVVSLEDPIEYYIPGINQSQIRPEIRYDFATGLRSVVRQDPDIIMVGEIRDKETAAMAIHAALTGHLVLSTLHTNNAIGVIPRLIDMGVDPFLIPPTLILALGQRLVRKLCPVSVKKVKPSGRLKEVLSRELESLPPSAGETKKLANAEFSKAEVSSSCPKGTRGRTGVFEVFSMTPELEKIILSEHSEAKLMEEARRQGMITMRQDGILKASRGIIGLEELFEVV